MPTTVKVDGCEWKIQMLPTGIIRVQHAGGQQSPMHGPGTSGDHEFLVYPCQRHQFEFLNAQLPHGERATNQPTAEAPADPAAASNGPRPTPATSSPPERPWWSFGAGERAGLRD